MRPYKTFVRDLSFNERQEIAIFIARSPRLVAAAEKAAETCINEIGRGVFANADFLKTPTGSQLLYHARGADYFLAIIEDISKGETRTGEGIPQQQPGTAGG